jgi:hypothetical protein
VRRVFVLLLVLGLAAGLYLWSPGSEDPVFDAPLSVRECAENLRAIHAGLLEYQRRHGSLPERAGTAFLGALIADGVWLDTPGTRARLTCPGAHAEPVLADVDFRTPGALSLADSAYAVRDFAAHPLAKFPSGGAELEPLIGCDNARGSNHDGCTNLLYTDGSVKTFTLAQEIERGTLAPGAEAIPVGPDSPLPDLRKLLAD